MGFFSRLKRANPFSTGGAVGISAHACHAKYPQLSFREALERSLVETRPGWNAERIATIRGPLDKARTPDEMIDAVAAICERYRW
jgi:hypothetical protein